eukprot:UN17050
MCPILWIRVQIGYTAYTQLSLQWYARNLFLRYILRKFLRFLQYFEFYMSYDPDFSHR